MVKRLLWEFTGEESCSNLWWRALRKTKKRRFCSQPDFFLSFLPRSSVDCGTFCPSAGTPAAAPFLGLTLQIWHLWVAMTFFSGGETFSSVSSLFSLQTRATCTVLPQGREQGWEGVCGSCSVELGWCMPGLVQCGVRWVSVLCTTAVVLLPNDFSFLYTEVYFASDGGTLGHPCNWVT